VYGIFSAFVPEVLFGVLILLCVAKQTIGPYLDLNIPNLEIITSCDGLNIRYIPSPQVVVFS
jgi:hypothetical protein